MTETGLDFEVAFAAFAAEYQAPALAAVPPPRAEAKPEPELEAG
jgi:hypothetical protein